MKLSHTIVSNSLISLCIIMVFAASSMAQGGGTGAKGGSNRPERRERTRTERQEPLQPPPPTPSPTPSASPFVTASPSLAQPSPTASPATTVTAEEEEEELGSDPGSTFFLYGVNVFARPRHEQGTSTKGAGGFALNIYLTRRVFVEIDNDNFVSLKPIGGDRTTAFGDTVLIVGADALLEKDESKRPNISFYYGVKVPTGSESKGIGTGEVDHILFGLVSKTLGQSKKSYAELNFTEYFAGDGAGNFGKTSSLGGVFKQWLVKEKYRLHFEIGGTFATKDSNAEMYNLDYFEYFRGSVSFRLGGRVGLTPNVPRAGFYAAMTWSGNIKNLFK